jgi:hypothetical protein
VLAQVPTLPGTLHAWQVPAQALLQHTPSTHAPLAHCAFCEQATPSPPRQEPAPLHTLLPAQPGGSWRFDGVLVQVPAMPGALQVWQTPVQAVLQQ